MHKPKNKQNMTVFLSVALEENVFSRFNMKNHIFSDLFLLLILITYSTIYYKYKMLEKLEITAKKKIRKNRNYLELLLF